MADNVNIADFSGNSQTMEAKNATGGASGPYTPYITSHGVQVTANFTRPANTTAYTAGDAVSNSTSSPTIITFSNAARFNGGTLRLSTASLVLNAAPPATPPNFSLLLFDTSTTPTNDNSPWGLSNADSLHCLTSIPLIASFPFSPIVASVGNNMIYNWEANGEGRLIKCASADVNLYAQLMIMNSYTPTSGETFNLTLNLMPE